MSAQSRSFAATGIVLKRVNVGETDRIINILTKDFGKMTAVAKGVRKLTSSKRAFLEPGNIVKGFFIKTKSLPLLTQATLVQDCSAMEQSLQSYRSLTQLLEIYEKLFVETELEPEIFNLVLSLRKYVVSGQAGTNYVRNTLGEIIVALGFQHPNDSKYDNISDYVSALADSKMKSYEYLHVRHTRT